MPSVSATSRDRRPDVLRRVVGVAVGVAALALVLPNHAPPWMSFLQELLAAGALAMVAVAALSRQDRADEWRALDVLVFGLVMLVLLQYATGLIGAVQFAWMHVLYLIGLLLALQAGAALERRSPALAPAMVLLSALLASAVSVGLQLYQWRVLTPGEGTTWVFRSIGGRPPGNLGQPNLLGSVHVLALLGLYWLWRVRQWPAAVTLTLAAAPMVGLALTQSRTGLLNAWLVTGALLVWHWRRRALRWLLPTCALVSTALFVLYALFGHPLDVVAETGRAAERVSSGLRPAAWRLFAAAVGERPLAGYGWGQTFTAQLSAAPGEPPLHRVFLSAHSLPIDLVLWIGLPVALAATFVIATWLLVCMRRARDDSARTLLLAVAVLLMHSMFEYPLEYAFFLLPFGLAAGAVGQRVDMAVLCRVPRWLTLAVLSLALAATGLTVRDYFRVEHSYRQLLLEKARIQLDGDRAPPDVLVLDSLRDLIVFSRLEPAPGMSDAELQWMAQVVRHHPGAHGFARVAEALALNGRTSEAQYWVDQLCRVFLPAQCRAQAEVWAGQASDRPALLAVRWP